jgi:hypothetical protein
MLIRVNAHTYMSIYVCTVFLKKEWSKNQAIHTGLDPPPYAIDNQTLSGAPGPQLQKVLERLTGQSTVPNVEFIIVHKLIIILSPTYLFF